MSPVTVQYLSNNGISYFLWECHACSFLNIYFESLLHVKAKGHDIVGVLKMDSTLLPWNLLRKEDTEKRACHFPLMAHSLGPSVTSHGITAKRHCQRDDCGMCVASVTRHRSSLAQGSEGEVDSPNQTTVTTEGVYEHPQHRKREKYPICAIWRWLSPPESAFTPEIPPEHNKQSLQDKEQCGPTPVCPSTLLLCLTLSSSQRKCSSPAGRIIEWMKTTF